MSGAQRWRSQSLIGHEVFTGAGSPANAEGHMPFYAEQAYIVATAGAQLAGMAKKRWRDGTAKTIDVDRVRALRAQSDAAFAALERSLTEGRDMESAVLDQRAADASFVAFGRLGYLALANIEEAGELAVPLHELAVGTDDPGKAIADAGEESADVRIYLHVTCESLRLNQTSTTDDKWRVVQKRWPEIFAPGARRTTPKVDGQAAAAALAAQIGEVKKT